MATLWPTWPRGAELVKTSFAWNLLQFRLIKQWKLAIFYWTWNKLILEICQNRQNFWTYDAICISFPIYNSLNMCNIVFFMTGSTISSHLGLAAMKRNEMSTPIFLHRFYKRSKERAVGEGEIWSLRIRTNIANYVWNQKHPKSFGRTSMCLNMGHLWE